MLFTVVTVCFQAESSIQRCLTSVLDQIREGGDAFDDFEYLIVDGGSTDGTLGIVRGFEDRFSGRMRVVSEPDDGIYDAMNKAIRLASGDYLIFVNADDWLEPNALSVAAGTISEYAQAFGSRPDFVGGAMLVRRLDGTVHVLKPDRRQIERLHPVRMPAGHQATLVRTQVARSIGGFRTRFRLAADYDFFLRAHEAHATWALIDEVLAGFTLGGASYAILPTASEYREVRRANGWSGIGAWLLFAKNVLGSLLAR